MINRASKLEGKMEKNGRSDEWKKKVFHKLMQKVNKLGKYL